MARLTVRSFVGRLVSANPPAGFVNPYLQPHAAHNLARFLERRDPNARTLLLVGEAPGYRGAALSGVALSSLSVLTDEWSDPWGAFGPRAGFRSPFNAIRREATATMVWSSLAAFLSEAPLPLTWNAVPFHPRGETDRTNLPLRSSQVALGSDWIEQLLQLFPASLPIAVGLRAHDALASLGITHEMIRHPSRGGKGDFQRGLGRLHSVLGGLPKPPHKAPAVTTGIQLSLGEVTVSPQTR